MSTDPLVRALRAEVGPAHVLVDPDATAAFTTDWTGRWGGTARAVVRPGTVGEVAGVLAACAAHGVAVVPQGGNTGLVGGGVPRGGEVVLVCTRLDALGAVDVDRREVTVGAGARLAAVQAHAAAVGLAYPVDLAARDSATIGGTVATDAGGIHVLRYGSTRAQVRGLEVVRADGRAEVVDDPAALDEVVGSEGTLAVVTAVRLGLVDPPTHHAAALL
ncbi:MAG: FAD-binding oxidoreductase, partial [Nitriliruptoraceae bacterium]